MSIQSNIEAVIAQVKAPGGQSVGDAIQIESLAALAAGEDSPQWQTYMQRFAQTEDQLARLLATDGTKDNPEMNAARTALVQNGECGGQTIDDLDKNVGDILDQGLPPA